MFYHFSQNLIIETKILYNVFPLSEINIKKEKYNSIIGSLPNKKYRVKSRVFSGILKDFKLHGEEEDTHKFDTDQTKDLNHKLNYQTTQVNIENRLNNAKNKYWTVNKERNGVPKLKFRTSLSVLPEIDQDSSKYNQNLYEYLTVNNDSKNLYSIMRKDSRHKLN